MLRIVTALLRGSTRLAAASTAPLNVAKPLCGIHATQLRCLSVFSAQAHLQNDACKQRTLLSQPLTAKLLPMMVQPLHPQVRTLTKFSLRKGKRKTVRAVVKRFFRLHWGGWIRTKTGRHKHLWKKSSKCKRRLRQHVFVSGTQAWKLDSMVTAFWRRPKYYVEDPYHPYHTREEFPYTRKKPAP